MTGWLIFSFQVVAAGRHSAPAAVGLVAAVVERLVVVVEVEAAASMVCRKFMSDDNDSLGIRRVAMRYDLRYQWQANKFDMSF
jgi:hypothetical protein